MGTRKRQEVGAQELTIFDKTKMADELKFPKTEAVLKEYGETVQRLYKENLVKSDALATETLYNTIKFHVKQGNYYYEVSLDVTPYWRYLEFGTKPHFPPVSALLKWIKVKPVIPRATGVKGKPITDNQLAYLIGRKISQVGTAPRHDLTNAVQATNREFIPKLQAAVRADLFENVRVSFQTFAV